MAAMFSRLGLALRIMSARVKDSRDSMRRSRGRCYVCGAPTALELFSGTVGRWICPACLPAVWAHVDRLRADAAPGVN